MQHAMSKIYHSPVIPLFFILLFFPISSCIENDGSGRGLDLSVDGIKNFIKDVLGVNDQQSTTQSVSSSQLNNSSSVSSNTARSCKSITVKPGDTCWEISSQNGITLNQLQEFNPPGIDCDSLQPGQELCVGPENGSSNTTEPCEYHVVKEGDTCWEISQSNNLTLDQLQELNVGLNCSNLMPGERICVGRKSTTETNYCNLENDAAKLQRDVPPNCKTVYSQEGNDTCSVIRKRFSLERTELAKLNPNYTCCEDDTFVLPFGQPLCMESYGETPTCLEEYVVKSGDTCWSIWVSHRLSEWEFRSLNEGINCSILKPGQSLCVSNQKIAGQECILTMIVQPGETCPKLAERAGITVDELQNLNKRNLNCENLQSQQTVCVSNDERLKRYQNNDQGPSKKMLDSAVREILDKGLATDQGVESRLQGYLSGQIPAANIIPDLVDILSTTEGSQLLKNLEETNEEFKEFASFSNDHRKQICNSISDSPYKTCVCNASEPFLNCQAKMIRIQEKASRQRRNLQNIFNDVTQMLSRHKRATNFTRSRSTHKITQRTGTEFDESFENYLKTYLDSLCGGCISSETGCVDGDICVPVFAVIEICLGGGLCVPNPLSLIDSNGHITVSQFEESRIGIDLALCITLLNEILSVFGADACIAKGGVDYFYLKQQLTFDGSINLALVRGSIKGRLQVAEAFTEGVYDTDAQVLLEDMCTEKEYRCKDYCQVDQGDLFLEWKVEGWFIVWYEISKGTKNDPPPCKPKLKKPVDSLNRIVIYTTSWAQYRAYNATVDGELITRPESCKAHARTPKDIDPSYVTHINYAFLVIDANTFELVNFERNDDELIAEMNALKSQNGGLKTLISVGGWSFSQGETGLGEETKHIFSNMAKTQETRSRFIKSAMDTVSKHGVDGIDIDWEYPLPEDRDSFTALLRELRTAIDASGKDMMLTFAAPAGRKWYSNMDLEVVHQFVDFINLMTYDFHGGSFEAGFGPNVNAPIVDCSCPDIEDIELGLESYLAAGVPSGKINLGLATYGRTFTLDSQHDSLSDEDTLRSGGSEGSGTRGVCTITPGVLSYYEIKDLVPSDKVIINNALMSAYARFDSNQWVGYDTTDTHNMKICFARRKRLGGLMVWDAEMDDNMELIKNLKSNIASSDCEKIIIADCPNSKTRSERAAVRPRKPKPTKKPGAPPECDRLPNIKYKDASAMRRCKGTKVGAKCKVVCKKSYKPTKPEVVCQKSGLKKGVWKPNDVECELNSDDCGKRPLPIIRVGENGMTGPTAYYVKFDLNLKLPIWSLYAQKKTNTPSDGRVNGFPKHDCYKNSQLSSSQYTNSLHDRGHLSPQNAFSFSQRAMKASNYMINVAPQDVDTNRWQWRVLESKVKAFLQDNPGYVVTGICSSVKYKGKLPIPTCFWKMICVKTTKGTTVGAFYHENTIATDSNDRVKQVQKVRTQNFVEAKVNGRNFADVWVTAQKLRTTVSGLPDPSECGRAKTLGNGVLDDLERATEDDTDFTQFWNDNIGSDKYGLKWNIEISEPEPEPEPGDDGDDDVDDDDDDNGDGDDTDGEDKENVPSGQTRNRCGHDIIY